MREEGGATTDLLEGLGSRPLQRVDYKEVSGVPVHVLSRRICSKDVYVPR